MDAHQGAHPGLRSILEESDPGVTARFAAAGRSMAITGEQPTVSLGLDQYEVPFPAPDPRAALVEPASGRDWRRLADRVGHRPVAALIGVALLAAVFAAFIARHSQSLEDDVDSRLANAGGVTESDATLALVPTDSGVDGVGTGAESGRSTGDAGDFGPVEYYAGQLSEPVEDLTSDITWETSTAPPPTSSSSSGPEQTVSSTTPTTPPASTDKPDTTVTAPPGGPNAVAIAPGRPSAQDPEVVTSEEIVLRAEDQGRNIQYRFTIHRWNEDTGQWEQSAQSRWRRRSEVRIDTRPYAGETVRWTVSVRDRGRNQSAESTPLYFQVPGGNGGDRQDQETAAPELTNGGFEGVDLRGRSHDIVLDTQVAGWSSSLRVIEIWTNSFDPSVQAASGTQFIELNSVAGSTISQVIAVAPGTTIRWSLSHRSRQFNDEAIEVLVRPVDGRGSWSDALTAPVGSWVLHDGTYRVPDDVRRIELLVRSVTAGSVGNFIDDVRVQALD